MEYRVLPLFYAANERFRNTIRFTLELTEDIDIEALFHSSAL